MAITGFTIRLTVRECRITTATSPTATRARAVNPGTRPTVGQTQQRLNQAGLGQRGAAAGNVRPGGTPGAGHGAGRGRPQASQPGVDGGGTPDAACLRWASKAAFGTPSQGSASRISPPPRIWDKAAATASAIGVWEAERCGDHGAFGGMSQGGARTQMNSQPRLCEPWRWRRIPRRRRGPWWWREPRRWWTSSIRSPETQEQICDISA